MNRSDPLVTAEDAASEEWFDVRSHGALTVLEPRKARNFRLVPTEATVIAVTKPVTCRRILVRVEQPASGGFTVTLDALISGSVTIATTASAISYFELLYDELTETWSVLPYEIAGTAAAAITTHVGLADPHTQYALESALGTMASQNANNVTITGGSVSGITLALAGTGGTDHYLRQTTLGGTVTSGAVQDAELSTSDVTTNNRTTSKHGFGAKLPNNSIMFESGTGVWRVLAFSDLPSQTGWTAGTHSTARTLANGASLSDTQDYLITLVADLLAGKMPAA